MQKQIVARDEQPATAELPWIDLEQNAKVQLTSEDPDHPIEAAFRGDTDKGWIAAEPGPQTIRLSFYTPQTIGRIYLCFRTDEHRTQEFVLRWSKDGGLTYREIVRQQYNFSDRTAREEETYSPDLRGLTDLTIEINPDISGRPTVATLQAFRLSPSRGGAGVERGR
jgi:hypothetical protein